MASLAQIPARSASFEVAVPDARSVLPSPASGATTSEGGSNSTGGAADFSSILAQLPVQPQPVNASSSVAPAKIPSSSGAVDASTVLALLNGSNAISAAQAMPQSPVQPASTQPALTDPSQPSQAPPQSPNATLVELLNNLLGASAVLPAPLAQNTQADAAASATATQTNDAAITSAPQAPAVTAVQNARPASTTVSSGNAPTATKKTPDSSDQNGNDAAKLLALIPVVSGQISTPIQNETMVAPAPATEGAGSAPQTGTDSLQASAPIDSQTASNPPSSAQAAIALITQASISLPPSPSTGPQPFPQGRPASGTVSQPVAVPRGQSNPPAAQSVPQQPVQASSAVAGVIQLDPGTWELTGNSSTSSSFDSQSNGLRSDPSAQSGTSGANEAPIDPHLNLTNAMAAPPSGTIAFEAKLSPIQNGSQATDAAQTQADPAAQSPAAQQVLSQAMAKPLSTAGSADTDSSLARTAGLKEEKIEKLFQADAASTPLPSATATHSDSQPATLAPAPSVPAAVRMQAVAETPTAPASSHQSIAVNVSDGAGDAGIHLRFLERGGEIHVSVRAADAGVAQDLRGGLNDLVGRLEHAGIHTEISTSSASAGNSSSEHESQDTSQDRRGSERNQRETDDPQQNSRNSSRSSWMEILDDSTGQQIQSTRSN